LGTSIAVLPTDSTTGDIIGPFEGVGQAEANEVEGAANT
jgi:hypothetical protein